MTVRVVKIGGSTWGEPKNGNPPDSVRVIADQIRAMAETDTVIPVVSAYKGVTNALINKARVIENGGDLSETEKIAFAAYVSSGETEAATLLALQLNTKAFQGWQVPFHTHGEVDHAEIDLPTSGSKLVEYLSAGNNLAVVAGFQGLDPHKNITTTFARGGTDYSAIATAIILQNDFVKAGEEVTCQIVRNEGGVRTADPKLVSDTRIHKQLSHDELLAISIASGGQQLIQTDAAALAKERGINLSIGPLNEDDKCTRITGSNSAHGNIIAVACNNVSNARDFVDISIVGWNMTEETAQKARQLLEGVGIHPTSQGKETINDVAPDLAVYYRFSVRNDAHLIKAGVNALHAGFGLAE